MEQYGEKPKLFTKVWWEYFWDYNKWKVLIGALVLFVVLVGAYQCTTRKVYDMEIVFAGASTIAEDKEQALKDRLCEVIADYDENGEKNIYIQKLAISDSAVDAELNSATAERLLVEIMAGDTVLYIFSKELADNYLNTGSCEDNFAPVYEWTDELPEKDKLAYSLGVPYAVKLAGSKALAELGINSENAYLMLRVERYDETGKADKMKLRENAVSAANFLIG